MTASRKSLKMRLMSQGLVATALLVGSPALADAVATPAEGGQVTDIVVTATRHAESLSKVAASVEAFNEKALDVRGVKGMDQISQLTPGLSLNANGFGTQTDISIRGVDSQVGSATTGVYIDDTPIMTRVVGYSSTNTYPQVFDLDRVEVLRGPQGTLFGAGSEGGTVRFITPQPSLTRYSAYARAELAGTDGGDASYEAGGAVGGPIVADKLGFRVSLWDRHDGGYVDRKNLNPGLVKAPVFKNANWSDTQVGRAALTWAPTERLTVTPSIFFQNRNLNDIGTFWEGYSAPGAGKFVNGQPGRQPDHDLFILPSLNVRYDLGAVEVVSNTSMFQRKDRLTDDYSTLNPAIFTPLASAFGFVAPSYFFAGPNWVPNPSNPTLLDTAYNAPTVMLNKQTVWTEELRVQSADKAAKLTWTTGLFLSQSVQKSYEDQYDPNFAELWGFPAGTSINAILGAHDLIGGNRTLVATSQGIDKQAAGFGEASYQLTDKLKLTGGLRVARASFTGSSTGAGAFLLGPDVVQPKTRVNETPVTPKAALSYQLDPNNLFYASASKGYRIGGTNAPLSAACAAPGPGNLSSQGYSAAPLTYNSDSVWSYELGSKNKLFDRHLEIGASVYRIDWSNIQQLVYVSSCGQQFVDNLGKAQSNGFDLQFAFYPAQGLTLDGALGYTDATYSKTVNKNPAASANVVSGGDHLDTNPWSATFGFTYEHTVLGGKDGYARLDYTYHSKGQKNPLTDPNNGGYDPAAVPAPATNLLNLRAGVRFDGFDVSLFANNLTNTHPKLTRYSEVIGNPVHRDFTFRPLTIGVTVGYRY
jgi:iron complex outermembrane recepter protein